MPRSKIGEVDALAARVAMSRRSFTRHFRKLTGTSVIQWLLLQRLALAQRLLETSDHSIERVAEAAGFGSASSLRTNFAAAYRITPTAWRREFRGAQPPAKVTPAAAARSRGRAQARRRAARSPARRVGPAASRLR